MKKFIVFSFILLLSSICHAQTGTTTPLFGLDQCIWWEEEDGSPLNPYCGKIKVTNGTFTDNGDGTFSLSTGAGGGGGDITDVGTCSTGSCLNSGNTTLTGSITVVGTLNLSGNLGIGTSVTPTFPLEVSGDGTDFGSLLVLADSVGAFRDSLNGISGIEMYNASTGTSADFRFLIKSTDGDYLAFAMPGENNSLSLFGEARSGAGFIFTNTSGGSGRDLVLGTVTAHDLVFGTTNLTRLTIASGGDITQLAGSTFFMGGLLDAVGAVDMDYGSADITDHTFVSDGGTVIIDGNNTTVGGTLVCLADGTNCLASGSGDITDVGDCSTGSCLTSGSTTLTGSITVVGTLRVANNDVCQEDGTNCPSGVTLTDNDIIVYVGKWGNDANDGLTPNDAKLTIASANTASSSGDAILVYPGTYSESSIALKDGVDLVGVDRDKTIITASMTGASDTDGKGILEPAGSSTISNITIIDTTNPNSEDFTACLNLEVNGQNVTLDNVYCEGAYDGIYSPQAKTGIGIVIKNSEIVGDYDAVGFFPNSGSTLTAYNSSFEGRGAVTSRPGRAVTCGTGGNTGTETECHIYNSRLIASSSSSDDAHCVWSGTFGATSDAANFTIVNSDCLVTSNSSNIGSGAASNVLATTTNIDIYDSTIRVSGAGTNYAADNNAGTFNIYNSYLSPTTLSGAVAVTHTLSGTTTITSTTGTLDASGASLILPQGTTCLGGCDEGGICYDTNATTGQRIYACESGVWTLQGDGGGGSSAAYIVLNPGSASITGTIAVVGDATQGAQIDGSNGFMLLFDATTDEGAAWRFLLPDNWASHTDLKLMYSMASGTANEVEWEAAVMCQSAGDSEQDNADGFAAIAVASDTVPASARYPDTVTITLTDDSCAAGDLMTLFISTDADDATNDDATGDRQLLGIVYEYGI